MSLFRLSLIAGMFPQVLALRVREYLQQAVTSGGVGHSHPSHHHLSTTRYQTSRDKLNIVRLYIMSVRLCITAAVCVYRGH